MRANLKLTLGITLLAGIACVQRLPLDAAPCPCSVGYCCRMNKCVLGACEASGAPGTGGQGGEGGSAGSGTAGAGAAGTGTAGATGTAGTTGAAGTAGTADATGVAGDPGTADAGTAGTTGTAGATGAAGAASAGTTGTAGTSDASPSPGCGMMPGARDSTTGFVKHDIMVTGVDPAFVAAHPPLAGGTYTFTMRNYYLRLPKGYDPNLPVPIDMAENGCGGTDTVGATGAYTLPAGAGQTEALQVGLSYVPSASVTPGCPEFADDFVNSPEPQYLDAVIDDIAAKYCVNRNKIFVNGYDAWETVLSGCTNQDKVRAFGVQIGGGLRLLRPLCMNKPVAAMFVVGTLDTGIPIGPLATPQQDTFGSAPARDELLKRNGCVAADFQIVDTCAAGQQAGAGGRPCTAGVATGDTFGNAPHAMWNAKFPKCQMYTGCPAKFPVVWCPLDVNHGNGPNPAGPDSTILPSYRLTAMWEFFSSLPPE
jgi:hypothetical protein